MRRPAARPHRCRIRSHRAADIGRCASPLPLVLPAPEGETPQAARAALARLARALRAERLRGRAGQRSYDLRRHLALSQALARQTARLRLLERQGGGGWRDQDLRRRRC